MTFSFTITLETPHHFLAIETIHDMVFGPGRFTRTAFRVREGIAADPRFCFVAQEGGEIVGSVRMTRIAVGEGLAYLLGPLCVANPQQGEGIGKALVRTSRNAVHEKESLPVILVGDAPYYAPLNFEHAPQTIKMPGPVNYQRLLISWPAGSTNKQAYDGVMRGVSVSLPG